MNNEEAADLMAIFSSGCEQGSDMAMAADLAWRALRTPPATGAAMREAAAKVCDEQAEGYCLADQEFALGAERCAAAIRALPAPEVPDQMAAFGAAAWGLLKTRYGAAEMCEGDEAFIELALKAGLCTRQPYDREQHGYVEDADEGDMIYVWGNR